MFQRLVHFLTNRVKLVGNSTPCVFLSSERWHLWVSALLSQELWSFTFAPGVVVSERLKMPNMTELGPILSQLHLVSKNVLIVKKYNWGMDGKKLYKKDLNLKKHFDFVWFSSKLCWTSAGWRRNWWANESFQGVSFVLRLFKRQFSIWRANNYLKRKGASRGLYTLSPQMTQICLQWLYWPYLHIRAKT